MNNTYACHFKTFLKLPTVLLLFVTVLSSAAFGASDAAKIFKQNCAVCHKLTKDKSTGPGLEGIGGRVNDDMLFKWIKDNSAVLKTGDPYFTNLVKEYNGAAMTVFDGVLTDDEIKDLIVYIKNPPAPAAATNTAAPVGATSETAPKSNLNWYLILGAVAFFLVVLINVLRNVRMSLQKVVNEKEGVSDFEDRGFWGETRKWMNANKTWVAVGILILVGWFMNWSWYTMKDIGVYTNYKPEQPIKFSHKIHAGDNAINCQYCHFTVEKSRHSGIPPVSVCMNCHKGIDQGPTTGKAEIAKIYEAAGFNPSTGAYDLPKKPISWIKVHNLPDHVYFSHQQHVKVGKLDCANCHGDVKEMTVAQQVKPLTMGWCIDCHRTTEVAGMQKGNVNPYYEDLHKKLSEKYKGQKITVDKIGGIECAKCHY